MRKSEEHLVSTHTASLALYDRASLTHRSIEREWFAIPDQLKREIRAGNLVSVDAPMGGVYSIRFTNGELRKAEEAYVVSRTTTWLRVPEGRLACTDLACVPSLEQQAYCIEQSSAELEVPRGRLRLDLTALSIEEGLEELPHLVVKVTPLPEGVRAPSRSVRPLELWRTTPGPVRKKSKGESPAPATSSGKKVEMMLKFPTVAGVVLVDPERAKGLRNRPRGWTSNEEGLQDSLSEGALTYVRTLGEGIREAHVAIRLMNGGEVPTDRTDAVGRLRIESGELAVGGTELITKGKRVRLTDKNVLKLLPGDYRVSVSVSREAARVGRFEVSLSEWRRGDSVNLPENIFDRRRGRHGGVS